MPRPEPSAARIAISRWRTAPRTSSRFATFMQAMSSTSPASPSIVDRATRHQALEEAHRKRTRHRFRNDAHRDFPSPAGYVRCSRPATTSAAACAAATLTPGRSRADDPQVPASPRSVSIRCRSIFSRVLMKPERHESFDVEAVIETVKRLGRHADHAGRHAVERTIVPTTDGSPPKRRCQNW